MEFSVAIFNYLSSTLESIGPWAYALVFVLAVADSIIIIGSFTAGAAFLFLIGVLVLSGTYALLPMTFSAASGAILGGFINYLLGYHGTGLLVRKAQIKKHEAIERGERILAEYGGPGVLIGRFLGPLGSMISFVAGWVEMPMRKFLFWNILAGTAWAVVFLLLGAFFGNSISIFQEYFSVGSV
jgi:undecaprenyl-diphosphatase